MFAARQWGSVSTELHDVRRNVSLCGVIVLPGVRHWVLELWPLTRSPRQKHEPQGLVLCVCCFQHMMRRSNLRIFRTTLNHALACVCFRSAARFAKQNVFLQVCEVHVGRQATHRVQPSPFHVGMRFSTFLLLFCLSFFLKEKNAGHSATKGARHEVLHQILWRDKSGSHQLFFFFSVSVIDRRCPRMFGTSGGGAAVIGNIVLR